MSEEHFRVDACCYSNRRGVSIGFGTECTNDESILELGEDWIYEGLEDSFWENYQEFEPGIAEARNALKNDENDCCDNLCATLHRVFGEFEIEYLLNGEKKDLKFDVDVNSLMYNMLSNSFINDNP